MRGGWPGVGMATVGIHPNDFNLNPNKIPTGGVVQNCRLDSHLISFCLKDLVWCRRIKTNWCLLESGFQRQTYNLQLALIAIGVAIGAAHRVKVCWTDFRASLVMIRFKLTLWKESLNYEKSTCGIATIG